MSDSRDDILLKIVAQIQDARYLFLLGIVIAVLPSTTIAAFQGNTLLLVTIVVIAFVFADLIALLEFFSDRQGGALGGWVVLRFPQGVDASQLRILRCEYTIDDPRRPTASKKGAVRAVAQGSGWICPVPKARPDAVIDFKVVDQTDKIWQAKPFVPQLGWPLVDILDEAEA